MIRRGTTYGPPLPPGVMEDDGADRGLMFAFVGAHLDRQFEFVQSEWVNDGKFIGSPADKDPLAGDGGDDELRATLVAADADRAPAERIARPGGRAQIVSFRRSARRRNKAAPSLSPRRSRSSAS